MKDVTFDDFRKVVKLWGRYADRCMGRDDPAAHAYARNAAAKAVRLLAKFVAQAETKNTDAALLKALADRRRSA